MERLVSNNTLKFEKKKKIVNLDDNKEAFVEIIEVGDKHRFTMRDFRLQEGHDDSLPYVATLCDNGKPLCKCLNDGWGGETDLIPLNVQLGAIMVTIKKAISAFKWSYKGTTFDLTLDFIADTLALSENIKLKRTIKGRTNSI